MLDPNRTIRLAGGALFDSETTWRAYLADAGDWTKTALLLTGPLIVFSAILAYLLGFLSPDAGIFGRFRPTIASTITMMLLAAIGATVVAYIFGTLSGFFGGKRSFALGLAATTLAFVPGYVGQALSNLPWIGGLLGLALFIYALVLLWRIIPVYLEVPAARRTGHYVTSLLATIAVMVVFSMSFGRMLNPDVRSTPYAGMAGVADSVDSNSVANEVPGYLGDMIRQGEIFKVASQDRYDPPADGRLSETQVLNYLEVMEKTQAIRIEKEKVLLEMSERAERENDLSAADFMAASGQARNLMAMEMQIVKDGGGNWAEFQWVQRVLQHLPARHDDSDEVRHNRALYEKYQNRLTQHSAR